MVILDAPPLNPVADAQILLNSTEVDGAIVVARARQDDARPGRAEPARSSTATCSSRSGSSSRALRNASRYGYESYESHRGAPSGGRGHQRPAPHAAAGKAARQLLTGRAPVAALREKHAGGTRSREVLLRGARSPASSGQCCSRRCTSSATPGWWRRSARGRGLVLVARPTLTTFLGVALVIVCEGPSSQLLLADGVYTETSPRASRRSTVLIAAAIARLGVPAAAARRSPRLPPPVLGIPLTPAAGGSAGGFIVGHANGVGYKDVDASGGSQLRVSDHRADVAAQPRARLDALRRILFGVARPRRLQGARRRRRRSSAGTAQPRRSPRPTHDVLRADGELGDDGRAALDHRCIAAPRTSTVVAADRGAAR